MVRPAAAQWPYVVNRQVFERSAFLAGDTSVQQGLAGPFVGGISVGNTVGGAVRFFPSCQGGMVAATKTVMHEQGAVPFDAQSQRQIGPFRHHSA